MVPALAMAVALASAWSRPNSVSCSPCTSRVGAVIFETTCDGLLRVSRPDMVWSSLPVWATVEYAWQSASIIRPHLTVEPVGPVLVLEREPEPEVEPVSPTSNDDIRVAAQDRLNTPSPRSAMAAGVGELAAEAATAPLLGNSAWARLFQVATATTASTRGSVPASINDSAPP